MQERGGCIDGRAAAGTGESGSARSGECMPHTNKQAREARGRLEPGLDIVGVCWRRVVFEFYERKMEPKTENVALFPGKPWTVVEDSFVLEESLGALHIGPTPHPK
jgi:hypothetical protein